MARDWTFHVSDANDQDPGPALPWATARVGFVLNSPGYIEVDLLPEHISDDWTPGNHRLHAYVDGELAQSTYLTHLDQSGPPEDIRYTASGVGLESIFDYRIVHNEWAARQTVPEHLETLLEDLQVLQGGGDMGFSNTVDWFGSFTNEPLLSTCLGVVAGDFIRELAGRGVGFDWELWIYDGGEPYLMLSKPKRGIDNFYTIAPENCQKWEVSLETSDLLTTVTAIGEQSDPWGPRHNLARTGLGNLYGRHEKVIDTDHGGDGDADEIREKLYDAAYAELQAHAGARLAIRAGFISGLDSNPWPQDFWAEVQHGDTLTIDLPSYFGGTGIEARCTEFSFQLEPGSIAPSGEGVPGLEFQEYVFDALVSDITEGAESS